MERSRRKEALPRIASSASCDRPPAPLPTHRPRIAAEPIPLARAPGYPARFSVLPPVPRAFTALIAISVAARNSARVGGASGPLVGTFFMELGKALPEQPTRAEFVAATDMAINAVKARGRSEAGQKTLLDVLVPVQAVLAAGGDARAIALEAVQAADRTTPMLAIRGRASFLGERSMGHMDPGSRSTSLLIGAAVKVLEFEARS